MKTKHTRHNIKKLQSIDCIITFTEGEYEILNSCNINSNWILGPVGEPSGGHDIYPSTATCNFMDSEHSILFSIDADSETIIRDGEDITNDDVAIARSVREFLFNKIQKK